MENVEMVHSTERRTQLVGHYTEHMERVTLGITGEQQRTARVKSHRRHSIADVGGEVRDEACTRRVVLDGHLHRHTLT